MDTTTKGRSRDLLIVDDDPNQVRLFEIMLEDLGLEHRCIHALSGQEALKILLRTPPYKDAPRPELIILDLNMPGMHGCDLLRELKRDPEFRGIPVIMFSSTGD